MAIRVLIADDHPIVRSGVRGELARHADIEVIGEATNGDEAVQHVEVHQPDVLLLDIQMPGMKATEVIRRTKRLSRPVRVLVLTAYGDVENVHDMLGAGAAGYLMKDEAPEVIADAVRAVATGRTWLSNEVLQTLTQYGDVEVQRPVYANLSEREVQVLTLVALGSSNAQTATALDISEGTIRNHLNSIYDKLGVHTRAEAVVWAWQHGMARTEQ
jgi:DNA-binding NarL/FixJ family response regulator